MDMDWPLAYTVSFVRSLAVVVVKPPLHCQLLFVSMEISPCPIPIERKSSMSFSVVSQNRKDEEIKLVLNEIGAYR